MNKIGFQNFRRFIDFDSLEYKGITFLVGRNNAGKSTMVKALLLVSDFLKSNNIKCFQFGRGVLEDANIVTYDRAKNFYAKENFISFNFQLDNFKIDIKISGENDATAADVYLFSINDLEQGFEIKFEPQNASLTFTATPKSISEVESGADDALSILQRQLAVAKKELKSLDSAEHTLDSIEKRSLVADIERKITDIRKIRKSQKTSDHNFKVHTSYNEGLKPTQIFDKSLADILANHTIMYNEIQSGKKQTEEFKNLKAFKEEAFALERCLDTFIQSVQSLEFIYLGANPAKQSALFPIRDKNNALAQSIHDYYQLRINPGEAAQEFVETWMSVFEVGDSFEIKLYAGEAYEVKIRSNEFDANIHLADKGMGSIQAMLLIFRLAAIIYKTKNNSLRPTLIIEEPELNLHPALQSKLADLFYEVYEQFGIKVIVETHSEYLIRRSQVLVAEKELEVAPNENPFSVYYFQKQIKNTVYELSYQQDGTFDTNFGRGFFDEASSNTLELLKLKRQKKA